MSERFTVAGVIEEAETGARINQAVAVILAKNISLYAVARKVSTGSAQAAVRKLARSKRPIRGIFIPFPVARAPTTRVNSGYSILWNFRRNR